MSDMTTNTVAPVPSAIEPAAATPAEAPKPQGVTVRTRSERSFVTRPSTKQVTPQVTPQVAPQSAPEVAPGAAETTDPEPGAEVALEAGAVVANSTAAEDPKDPEKLSAAEESLRHARLRRHAEKVRQELASERQKIETERQQTGQLVAGARLVEKAFHESKGDPLAFAAKAFGMTPEQVINLALDRAIGTKAKEPHELVREQASAEAATLREKIERMERESQEAQKQQAAAKHAADVAHYKATEIRAVLADAKAYPLTLRALGAEQAAEEVFDLQQRTYRSSAAKGAPVVLSAKDAAAQIEAYLVAQRDLLVEKPTAPAKPAKKEPEPKKTQGADTHSARFRPTLPSFTVRGKSSL